MIITHGDLAYEHRSLNPLKYQAWGRPRSFPNLVNVSYVLYRVNSGNRSIEWNAFYGSAITKIDYQSIIATNLYQIAGLKSTTGRTDLVGIEQKGKSSRLVCRFLYC